MTQPASLKNLSHSIELSQPIATKINKAVGNDKQSSDRKIPIADVRFHPSQSPARVIFDMHRHPLNYHLDRSL
jgi:hypothetical protein